MLRGIIDWIRQVTPPQGRPDKQGPDPSGDESSNKSAPDRVPNPALLEGRMSGWFLKEISELYRGFPIQPDDRVLDVGCGDGSHIKFCANVGAEVIFADIDAEKIAAAVRLLSNTPARIICPIVTDAKPLPLGDETANKVIAMEVLEHVDDPAVLMNELYRVGTADAKYLITVPDPVGENLQKSLAPPEYFQKPNHIHIFEREEFDKLVTDSGLVIEEKSYYGFYWSLWWLLFWTARADFVNPLPPILRSWNRTWHLVLKSEQGAHVKKVLDDFMPKNQAIIARKR